MKHLLFLTLSICLLWACNNSEIEDFGSPNSEAIIQIEKNGNPVAVNRVSGLLENLESFKNSATPTTRRRLNLIADLDTGTLTIELSNWEWQDLPAAGLIEKTYATNADGDSPNVTCSTTNPTCCDVAEARFQQIIDTINNIPIIIFQYTDLFSSDEEGSIIITENNMEQRTLSGTFDFKVEGFGELIHFTGSFEDVSF